MPLVKMLNKIAAVALILITQLASAQDQAQGTTPTPAPKKKHHHPYHLGNHVKALPKNNNEKPEPEEIVTPGAPPLIFVDDAGTPDPGKIEANFSFNGEFAHNEKSLELPLYDLNLGMLVLGKRIQLKVEVPTQVTMKGPNADISPIAPPAIGVKMPLPFLDDLAHRYVRNLDLAFYPQIQFESGSSEKVLKIPVIIQRSFEHLYVGGIDLGPISVVANFGYNQVLHSPVVNGKQDDPNSWDESVAMAKKVNSRMNAMIELGASENTGTRGVTYIATTAGVTYELVHEKLYIYSSAGLDLVRNDEGSHIYAQSGLKWLFDSHLGKNHLVGKLFRERSSAP